jgi:hypothetical protein
MTMRRIPLVLALLVALAGCSSGATTTAGSTQSTVPTAAASESATPAPSAVPTQTTAAAVVSGGGATDFCGAFKELQTAQGVGAAAAVGAGFRGAAADMRTFAPAEIKAAAGTYADLIDNIGQGAQAGNYDANALKTALAGKAADIAQVAVWVGKNCNL